MLREVVFEKCIIGYLEVALVFFYESNYYESTKYYFIGKRDF